MVKGADASEEPSRPGPRDVKQLAETNASEAQSAPRMRLASISDPEELGSMFQEASTMDISLRASDFGGVLPNVRPRSDRAVLLRMDGVSAGQVVGVTQMPFSVGRHPTNQLSVDDDSISRFHARFTKEGDQYYVEDLGSRNGTFIEGKRVTRAVLKDDDWVQLGARVAFRFTLTDHRQEGLMRQLYESSTRDALTGAYNRRHFEDRLRAEIAFAVRHGTDLSLLILDIDHFKRINDTFGHPAGDEVLRQVTSLALRTLRTEDIFARFGGEEFTVLMRGSSTRGGLRLGDRLREALARAHIEHEGQPIPVTLSAGCAALSCCRTPTPEELVGVADRRLYLAKQAGRNRVVASD